MYLSTYQIQLIASEGVSDRWDPKQVTWRNGQADDAVTHYLVKPTRSARIEQADQLDPTLSLLSGDRELFSRVCSARRHPAAMVSWNDGDSSESVATQYISSSGSPVKIPATIDDPYHFGDDDEVMCEHGKPGKKYVAFEGISTGRRFIACGIVVSLQISYVFLVVALLSGI